MFPKGQTRYDLQFEIDTQYSSVVIQYDTVPLYTLYTIQSIDNTIQTGGGCTVLYVQILLYSIILYTVSQYDIL